MLRAICFLAVLAATQAASLRAMPTAADMARDQDKLFKKEVDLPMDPGIKREFMYSAKDWKTAPTAENKIPEWVQQAKMRAPGLPQTPPPPPPMQIPPPPPPTMQDLGFGAQSFLEKTATLQAARGDDKADDKAEDSDDKAEKDDDDKAPPAADASPAAEAFKAGDTDANGTMDLNEFTALFRKMMGQMGAAPQMQQQQQQFQAFGQGGMMGMNPMMGMIGQGTMMGNPSLGGANGMGSPSMMYAMPGKGFVSPNFPGAFSIYPAPGSRPLSAQSPYSMYSFGGYDSYGFPLAHPGVPSSTPPPPVPPEAGAAAR